MNDPVSLVAPSTDIPECTMEPVVMYDPSIWSQENEPEDEPPDPGQPNFCFYSLCGQTPERYCENLNLPRLIKLTRDNFFTMKPTTFAALVQNYYNKHIRNHMVDENTDEQYRGPCWP